MNSASYKNNSLLLIASGVFSTCDGQQVNSSLLLRVMQSKGLGSQKMFLNFKSMYTFLISFQKHNSMIS